jgi:hypothetical protein
MPIKEALNLIPSYGLVFFSAIDSSLDRIGRSAENTSHNQGDADIHYPKKGIAHFLKIQRDS